MMTLLQGDCLEIMDRMIKLGLQVDAVITDPPYGMGYQSNHRTEKHKKIEKDDCTDWVPSFFEKAYAVLKQDSLLFCFCSHHKIDVFKQAGEKFFNFKSILVWDKGHHTAGDLKGDFGRRTEFILFFPKVGGFWEGGETQTF